MGESARRTVLVIDDERDIRDSLAEILEDEGYAVATAGDGTEGLRLARDLAPDLILSDIRMEGVNGLALLSRLAEDPATAAIPVVLMTAHPGEEGQRHAMELGADDYLPKPFSVERLVRTIEARLRRKEALARKAEERVERVCSSLSLALPHELRTPLTAILAGAALLTKPGRPLSWDRVNRVGQAIEASGRRLLRLVERFLSYARLELAANDPSLARTLAAARCTDPARIAGEAAREVAREAGRENDLVLDLASTPVAVSCEHLERLVRELADNAFKFSEPGTPVTVSARAGDELWRLAVEDSGRGMSTAEIASVAAGLQFDRRRHEQQGAGLGLAISRSIASLWGGRLELHPRPEGGLAATVSLPLAGEKDAGARVAGSSRRS